MKPVELTEWRRIIISNFRRGEVSSYLNMARKRGQRSIDKNSGSGALPGYSLVFTFQGKEASFIALYIV